MAEERLIDDDLDKNRKYKIRKNADGEDELYIDESANVGEEFETVGFEIPEFATDDDEVAIMTPEQFEAMRRAKQEEEERKRRAVESYIEKAVEKLAEPDYESALYLLNSAEEIDGTCGTVHRLKLSTLSRNFTDYTMLDDCVDTAKNVAAYCTDEQKAELSEMSAPLQQRIVGLEEKAAALHVEVESKKSERRETFIAERKRSIIWFSVTGVPFLVFLVLAIGFSTVMFAAKDGTNLILTIVFAALTLVCFIASVFTARRMWAAMQRVSLNEKNSSTKLGREYENLISDVKKLNTVLRSFKL